MVRQMIIKKNTVLFVSILLSSVHMQAMDPEAQSDAVEGRSISTPSAPLLPTYPSLRTSDIQGGVGECNPEESTVGIKALKGDRLSVNQWRLLSNVKDGKLDNLQNLINSQSYVGADFFDEQQNTPLHYAADAAGKTVYDYSEQSRVALQMVSRAKAFGTGAGALFGFLLLENLGVCCNYHKVLPAIAFTVVGGATAHYLTDTVTKKVQERRQESFREALAKRLALIQLLVDQNADKNERDANNKRPIHIVEQYEKKASDKTYALCFEEIKSKIED